MSIDIKDRIVKLVRIKASAIRPSPWNCRTHPEKQREILREILGEIGMAGAVLGRQLEDGSYCLIDGHMRREELGDNKIPMLVTDLNEEEANNLLSVYDPIGDEAGVDEKMQAELAKKVKFKGAATNKFISCGIENNKYLKEEDVELDCEGDELVTSEEDDFGVEVVDGDVENIELPKSHVRMIQLYLTALNVNEFEDNVSLLGVHLDTHNITDTVFKAIQLLAEQYGKVEPLEKAEDDDYDDDIDEGEVKKKKSKKLARV